MNTIRAHIIGVALLVMGLVPFAGAVGIGKVIVSVGQVEAVDSDGAKRDLKRRSAVFTTDTVATYSGAKAQLRFTDGSMVSLAQNSLFKIEEYEFGGSGGEKAVYNLIKGGLQTITGAIGHTNKQDYTLKTPVATIGIRGTFYQVFLTPSGGLVGFVKEGGIVVENANGDTVSIQPGEYFSMDSATGDVSVTDQPPEGFKKAEEDNASAEEGEDKEGEAVELEDGTVTITAESDDAAGVDTNPGSYDPVAGGSVAAGPARIDLPVVGTKAPAGAGFGIAFIGDEASADSYVVNALNQLYLSTISGESNVPTYIEVEGITENCYVCQFSSGSGDFNVDEDAGFDSSYGIYWGRWSNDFVVAQNGDEQTVKGPEFHYIYSDNLTPWNDLKSIGETSANFYLSSNTDPTASNGLLVTLSDFNIDVNFTKMEIYDAYIEVSGGVSIIGYLDKATPISKVLTTGLIFLDNNNGSGVVNGSSNIQFAGQNPSTASGVGIAATYELTDSSTSVVGAALLTFSGGG